MPGKGAVCVQGASVQSGLRYCQLPPASCPKTYTLIDPDVSAGFEFRSLIATEFGGIVGAAVGVGVAGAAVGNGVAVGPKGVAEGPAVGKAPGVDPPPEHATSTPIDPRDNIK